MAKGRRCAWPAWWTPSPAPLPSITAPPWTAQTATAPCQPDSSCHQVCEHWHMPLHHDASTSLQHTVYTSYTQSLQESCSWSRCPGTSWTRPHCWSLPVNQPGLDGGWWQWPPMEEAVVLDIGDAMWGRSQVGGSLTHCLLAEKGQSSATPFWTKNILKLPCWPSSNLWIISCLDEIIN